jgi:hypothetical protein
MARHLLLRMACRTAAVGGEIGRNAASRDPSTGIAARESTSLQLRLAGS